MEELTELQKKILEFLKSDDRAFTIEEINDALGLKSVEELKDLMKALNSMEDDYIITRTKKNNYMLFNNVNFKIGTMLGNKKGFGFVSVPGSDDVFIPPKEMNNAIDGDQVVVEIINITSNGPEGRIVKIKDRKVKELVGEYYIQDNIGHIKLDDERIKLNVNISKLDSMGAMDGHKVLVKLGAKLDGNNYQGKVIRVLGHKNDPGVDISSIVAKYGIRDTFPDDVMEEAAALPDHVLDEEMVGRKDLRDHMIFTIDGSDTKDIDDAVELNMLPNGNYSLGVHIADVSHYVHENDAIDKEAYERGTSVYLTDRVIPMLPHKLSNGICSLNPEVDRLAISCSMEIDKTSGEIINSDIFPSVIRSNKQMNYASVNQILESNVVPQGYEPYADNLKLMNTCAHILRKHKIKRGYVDFNSEEPKIIVDEKGHPIDIQKRVQGEGENLIEDFMIAANETVATTIFNMDLPFVYRVHGTPNEEKVTNFINFVRLLGYKVDAKMNYMYPKSMQQLIDSLKDKKEYPILSKLMLRSMQKAVYQEDNIGHYGLASKCYTHFTSPIRRYPDTTVHRLLHTYLFENKLDTATVNYWNTRLVPLTEHASEMEVKSDGCEREVDDMKMAEYMSDHINSKYDAIVSTVLNFGFFVELNNLIEGLVRTESLGNTYFYDEKTFSIKSNKDKKAYRLGDTVKVICVGASKESKNVDFEIYHGQEVKQNIEEAPKNLKKVKYGNRK